MKPHDCGLQYNQKGRNSLQFGTKQCAVCKSNMTHLQHEKSPLIVMKFVKKTLTKLITLTVLETNKITNIATKENLQTK